MIHFSKKLFTYRLVRSRDIAGLTQAQLAHRAGMPPAMIGRYEQGAALPSTPNLHRLCVALDTSADYLMGLSHKSDLE